MHTDSSHLSDRERAGLRGPVRTVREGTNRAEYDPVGRLISQSWLSNPSSEDSEIVRTITYDQAGRLLTETMRASGAVLSEKAYSYDDKGRVLRIEEGSGEHTSYHYDEQGQKIEIREVKPKANDGNAAVATGVDVVFADPEGIEFGMGGLNNASRIKTTYDEHNHPTETQAYDAEGVLLTRIVRTYDDKQRLIDLRVIHEDATSLFPPKQIAEMAAQSGASLDEIKALTKKAFRGMIGDSGRSVTYDSKGRRTNIVLHQGYADVSRTSSYNDHGDVVEELTKFTPNPKVPVGVSFRPDESGNLIPEKPASEWPAQPEMPESIVQYKYQYDRFDNWTEQTQSRSEGARPAGWEYTRRRELTYY